MELIGKALENRYEILEKIGNGGMATVYKAKCNILNRNVAIKVLKDEYALDVEFVKRFKAEAQAAASLSHPNIVSVYDVGAENGVNYIVMELLEGKTLKDVIAEKGKLSSEDTLRYASQIASALEVAHAAKIIHRDIKPQNIVLTANNIAKVTDFGIAKATSGETITNDANTMGSVHYFSPEHAKGGYTDEKSDIYSLGVVMYEMATGELPFEGDSAVSVAMKQIQEEPVPPKDREPTVSQALNDIILKAMQKNSAERYQNASVMLDDIFSAINDPTQLFFNMGQDQYATQVIALPNLDKETITSKRGEGKRKSNILTILICIIALLAITFLAIVTYGLIKELDNSIIDIPSSSITEAPLLVGKNYANVKEEYSKYGLDILVAKYVNSTEYEAGVIVEQLTQEGDKIANSKIEVLVSKGAEIVTVIDCVSKDSTVAKYELEALGLSVKFEEEVSDTVAANIVLWQSLEPNSQAVKGSTIVLRISKGTGKKKIIVPQVIGDSLENAKGKLTDLLINVVYGNDETKAEGVVLNQSLKQNAEVEEGTLIELQVNRLIKHQEFELNLSSLVAAGNEQDISVRVTASIDEGDVDTVYTSIVSPPYATQTIKLSGFSSAKLYIYINDTLVSQKTISF